MRDRRSFLSGLASLPLIGGAVTLIGRPTAAAVPVTSDLLDVYDEWLHMERRLLCIEKYGRDGTRQWRNHVPDNTAASLFHFPASCADWRLVPQPSTRAALVLSAVGCDLGGDA